MIKRAANLVSLIFIIIFIYYEYYNRKTNDGRGGLLLLIAILGEL